jgi:ADP-dependent NAD(P)H-hydrate dehydratase / NAD(P)H-hydrate epimerase
MIRTRPLYSAAEMRAADAGAIEALGIPGAVLMERAGVAAAAEILAGPRGSAAVVCGGGNNGGDGFVVARHLYAAGWDVECLLAADPVGLPQDARRNHDIAVRMGVPMRAGVPRPRLRRAAVVVDALLGTGFHGAPREEAARVIAAMDGLPGIVALDVPSGVDASTGTVAGDAVTAAVTVCFHGRKLGTAVEPGRSRSGRVVVADIGIPPQADAATAAVLAGGLEPLAKRPSDTKYSAGAVLVVGGARGFTGAPLMSSLAALRAGAGIAWIATPPDAARILEARVAEVMVRPLPEALELAERAGAVALGPGLGRTPEAIELAREVGTGHPGPTVIDADGLFAFAGDLAALAGRPSPAVLTPHEGEMGRLLGESSDWVRANRLEAVRRAAADGRCIVLLKGPDTLVADPDGRVCVSHAGPSGLATAGSGDVLTGVVAAMLARGGDAWTATCAAAEAHGRAGQIASERIGPSGIIATDVIAALPEALR